MQRLFELDITSAQFTAVGADHRIITAVLPSAVLTLHERFDEWTIIAKFTDGATAVWNDYYDSVNDNRKTLIWGRVDNIGTVMAEQVYYASRGRQHPLVSGNLPPDARPLAFDLCRAVAFTDPEAVFERVADVANAILRAAESLR